MTGNPEIDAGGGHLPVLAEQLLAGLGPQPGQTVVDCTFGAGGHALMFGEAIGPAGDLVAIDRDPDARARFEAFRGRVPCRARLISSEFSAALEQLGNEGLRASGLYMDLGMSSLQVDAAERGFSYSREAPLDMRMDRRRELTAAELVNSWPQGRIADVLRRFGEERYASGIARSIVRSRPLETTSQLVEAVKAGMPAAARFAGTHPARRSFQAIRIAVNGELEEIDAALPRAWDLLEVGGRIGIISFHSLEDRRVKAFLRDLARECVCPPELPVCVCGREPEAELLTRKPVTPGTAEIEANPRARSAKLRIAIKLREGRG